jgi:hypothetical protein
VSAYFTPQEWWSLGPDRIVSEVQQVYKNFITALDEHVVCARTFGAREDVVPLPNHRERAQWRALATAAAAPLRLDPVEG